MLLDDKETWLKIISNSALCLWLIWMMRTMVIFMITMVAFMMLVMVFMINKVIFITMRNEDDCNDVLYNSTEHYCIKG